MITVYREELLKVLNIYENELAEFIYRPMSPAMVMRMEDKLKTISCYYYNIDRNPVWKIPVKIVHAGYGSFDLQPDLNDVNVVSRNHRNDLP